MDSSKISLSPIKRMELIASQYKNVVSLAQGIPSFDTGEKIKEEAIKCIKQGKVAKYSLAPGLPLLRQTIAKELAKENMEYDPQEEIVVTAGAIEAITASLLSFLRKGDEVLIPDPTYTSYQSAIKVAGGKPVFVPLNEKEGWSFDLKKFEQKISSKTKAILFCNPNNPTGTIYTKEQLEGIGELAKKYNLFIISDEVYKDFIYNGQKFFTLAQDKRYRQYVIRIFSFSKSYSMTGWRVGFVHSDKKNIANILKIHDNLTTCAPVVSQYAALAALKYGKKYIQYYYQEYIKRLALISQLLDELKDYFSYQKPNSSYFVFPRYLHTNMKSWNFSLDLLEKARVAVVPGVAFGPQGEYHIRLSFGRTEEDIEKSFQRIKKYFATLK